MFDKQEYIKSRVWEVDGRLLDTDTAVKPCPICGDNKYSSEFSGADEYEDGKLPVCTQCLGGKETAVLAISLIAENSKIRICRKCKIELPIEKFVQVRVGIFDSSATCENCTGKGK